MTTEIKKIDSCEIQKRRVKSYLDTEVKEFAQYVIRSRAMPSIMDGLRLGARKILWAAITGDMKKVHKVKMQSLIGDTMKQHYNHGDASLLNTIVQLASTHVYKYSPLEVVGQIGSLRIPKCETAPRYLHIKKSKYLDFFKADFDLIERLFEDGDLVEPKYFLPIIPILLLWRTNSPGYGFSYRCFSYGLNEIIDNCIKAIVNGSCNSDTDLIQLKPCIEGVKPENIIFNSNKNCWYNVGEYIVDTDNDVLVITDLPFDINFEKFDEHLQTLIERNYIIKFTDFSQEDSIRYNIKFANGRLKTLIQDKWKFFQNMKLFSRIKKDTLNCIDQDGKTILFFDNPYELIDCFVRKRLHFYSERKTITIGIIKEDIIYWSERIKFIELVIEGKIIINNIPVATIKEQLTKNNLSFDVLKMNIEKLTKDEIVNMKDEVIDLKQKLEYIENSTIQEMYIKDLIEFKQKYLTITKHI